MCNAAVNKRIEGSNLLSGCVLSILSLLCKLHESMCHIKIVATRCHVSRLKCTKFDFGWGSAPDSLGSLQRSPRLPNWWGWC